MHSVYKHVYEHMHGVAIPVVPKSLLNCSVWYCLFLSGLPIGSMRSMGICICHLAFLCEAVGRTVYVDREDAAGMSCEKIWRQLVSLVCKVVYEYA